MITDSELDELVAANNTMRSGDYVGVDLRAFGRACFNKGMERQRGMDEQVIAACETKDDYALRQGMEDPLTIAPRYRVEALEQRLQDTTRIMAKHLKKLRKLADKLDEKTW